MNNDQPKAPITAEKMLMGRLHIIGNSMQPYVKGWNEILKEKDFVVELMESYAAQTCVDKQAEMNLLKTSIERINGVVKWQQEYCLDYVHGFREDKRKYEELKARADKMYCALSLYNICADQTDDENHFAHKLQDTGFHELKNEALAEYESIDKGK